MSNISVARSDFSEYEGQFGSPTAAEVKHARLRFRGWGFALLAGVALWAVIAIVVFAAIHAFS